MRRFGALLAVVATAALLAPIATADAPAVVSGGGTGTFAGDLDGDGDTDASQKVLAIGGSLVTAKPGASEVARRAAVTQWIELELEAIAAHRTNPARASRALALVSRAMYEAAVAGEASRDAAVAGAASTVLAFLFPDEGGRIHGLAQRAARASGEASSAGNGFALGRRIGEALITRAESDGSAAAWNGTPPVGPAFWIPTPPGLCTRRSSRSPERGERGISRRGRSSAPVRRRPSAAPNSSARLTRCTRSRSR